MESQKRTKSPTDRIGLRVSGENANFSIAQISPGYMNMTLVAFYFVKAKTLFLFYGETLGLANRCRVTT
jgi:hypothetical protein